MATDSGTTEPTRVLVTSLGSSRDGNNPSRVIPPDDRTAVHVPDGAKTAHLHLMGASGKEHGWAVVAFYRADGTLIERISISREDSNGG